MIAAHPALDVQRTAHRVHAPRAPAHASDGRVLARRAEVRIFLPFLASAACTASVPPDPNAPSDGKSDDPASPIYRPAPGTTWQWQLSGPIDTSFDVEMYDVDLFDVPDVTFAELAAAGRKIICYFSAGSREDWRPDAASFPAATLGAPLDDWPGERWIDIRSAAVRAIMTARLDRARDRGCDGVEPDNVDGYTNTNGLGLTAADQLDYNRFLARAAHARGLSIGLKNDLDQIPTLVDEFDWALNEQCFELEECDTLAPMTAAGKAVFEVEYTGTAAAICDDARARRLSTLIKPLELTAQRIACD